MDNITCRRCGTESPTEATFCGGCGASLLVQRGPKMDDTLPGESGAQTPQPGYSTPPPHQPYAQQPPPGQYQPPAQSGQYLPPVPPPGQQPPGYQNTYGMPTYAPSYEGNPNTNSWTWAGCLPYGIFAFANGSFMWGCFAWLPILSYVYPIYMGLKGREMAWQNRAFASVQQFEETMKVWSNWGFGCFIAQIIFSIIYFILVGIGAVTGMGEYY